MNKQSYLAKKYQNNTIILINLFYVMIDNPLNLNRFNYKLHFSINKRKKAWFSNHAFNILKEFIS